MPKFQLPGGMQDYLPEYLYKKQALENKIAATFKKYAYKRIETPKLERFELYSSGAGAVPPERFFKISDTDGGLLVLRADMTLPISRIVSTKMQPEYPLRLCYISDSYNLMPERNRSREFTQAGIELYGVAGAEGDAEVIALAIETLLNAGLSDFQIDIGQVEILKGVLCEAAVSEEQQKEIISAVDKKNLINMDISPEVAKVINNITMLYGDITVLQEASKLVNNKMSIDALLKLFEINHILCDYGYEKYISYDLGLVNSFSYYSGTVFKGITKHFGAPILGGGRYDYLCRSFDKDIPATGFAIGIKDLMSAIEHSGGEEEKQLVHLVIAMADSFDALAAGRKIALSATDKGLCVELLYRSSKEAAKAHGEKNGIDNVIFINDKGKIEEDEE
jgi:ATP phosphoribosyltransferase regulatory subunit